VQTEINRRKMPDQKPGKSRQDYCTPRKLIDAVVLRFGPIVWDLAAHEKNHISPNWYGQGSEFSTDSLKKSLDWASTAPGKLLWLNPPFGDISPWASKCADSCDRGAKIAFLVPASIGSEWFAKYVYAKSLVLALRPRISFDGKNPYPKDCILCIYGEPPGFNLWKWNE
jgi:phage N-6-adenine-methyltransferase